MGRSKAISVGVTNIELIDDVKYHFNFVPFIEILVMPITNAVCAKYACNYPFSHNITNRGEIQLN